MVAGDVGHHPRTVDQGSSVLEPAGGVGTSRRGARRQRARTPSSARPRSIPGRGPGIQPPAPDPRAADAPGRSGPSPNASRRRPPRRWRAGSIRPGPPAPRRNARCPRPPYPAWSRDPVPFIVEPVRRPAACSNQPAARSGMPRCTDKYPSSRGRGRRHPRRRPPGVSRLPTADPSGSNPSDLSPAQEIRHLGAAAASLMDQRPGQRDQGFGEQMMVTRPLREFSGEA